MNMAMAVHVLLCAQQIFSLANTHAGERVLGIRYSCSDSSAAPKTKSSAIDSA